MQCGHTFCGDCVRANNEQCSLCGPQEEQKDAYAVQTNGKVDNIAVEHVVSRFLFKQSSIQQLQKIKKEIDAEIEAVSAIAAPGGKGP